MELCPFTSSITIHYPTDKCINIEKRAIYLFKINVNERKAIHFELQSTTKKNSRKEHKFCQGRNENKEKV